MADGVLHVVARLGDHHLDDDLHLVGHLRRSATRHPVEEDAGDGPGDDRGVHRVDVERHAEEGNGRMVTDGDGRRQHRARRSAHECTRTTRLSGLATEAISTTWKTSSPMKTVQPRGRYARATRKAISVISPRRLALAVAAGPRHFSPGDFDPSTSFSVSVHNRREFHPPSPSPTQMNMPASA